MLRAFWDRLTLSSEELAVKDELNNLISSSRVLVVSKTTCPYCKKAKAALEANGAKTPEDVRVVETNERPDGDLVRKMAQAITGQSTVPNIWIGGKHIGGSDALAKFIEEGKFKPAFEAAAGKL